MIDNFEKQYAHEVNLCYQMLILSKHSKQSENLLPSQVRKLLLNFFTDDVINQAMKKIIGENIK